MMNKIAIIGAGNIGQACAHMVQDKREYEVVLWDKDTQKVPNQGSLEETLKDTIMVFLCVNSWAARPAMESMKAYIPSGVPIISPIKGIEYKTLKTVDEIIAQVTPDQQVALFNGPMLSGEMMEGHPAFAVIASKDRTTFDSAAALFEGTKMHVEYSPDVHGTALAGVLKNIYSIGLGMTEALKQGSNFRGWFVMQSLREMSQILEDLGGATSTAYGPAGLADLVATGFSPDSRNCRAGKELVQAGECITVSEGEQSLPQLVQLLNGDTSAYPILSMLNDVVISKENAAKRFKQIL